MHLHSWMAPLARYKIDHKTTPVSGAPIVGGLVPCNAIPDEILTDHPRRQRAMIVESSNPAHSLAESARWREALRALDLVVVIDVALTETARLADYVLPAASQFEKWEATFFNLEFPRNTFHLRAPLLEPLAGTLPEPEIWARLARALEIVPEEALAPLRDAARESRAAFATAFVTAAGGDPRIATAAPFVLYDALGPTLPDGAAAAAALWGLAHRCALTYPDAVRRAGHAGEGPALGEALFDAMLAGRSGMTFTLDDYEHAWAYVRTADGRIALAIPSLLEELRALRGAEPRWTSDDFPFVLSAGERRASTANTIIRDPQWRKRDPDGRLRIAPADAARLGLGGDGARARVTTAAGSVETAVEVSAAMQPGHVSLPNGLGLDYPDDDGDNVLTGVPLNELTSLRWRDPLALTPWHKHVPARVEAMPA